jgi:hypothetical protein
LGLGYDGSEVHLNGYLEGASSIRKKVWIFVFVFITGVESGGFLNELEISDLVDQSLKRTGMLILDTS